MYLCLAVQGRKDKLTRNTQCKYIQCDPLPRVASGKMYMGHGGKSSQWVSTTQSKMALSI